MAQRPDPMLDPQLSEEIPGEALENLEVMCQNSRLRIELERFLHDGKTGAEVAVVTVYGSNDAARKVLKHCPPPEGGLSLDALKYDDARNANQEFAQAHLAALDMHVPDGRGGIFLLMEWRGGGSRNYLPLTSFLDREALGGACRAVVKSVLIDWQEGRRPQQTLGSVTSHEVLHVIAGEKCMPNRSLYNEGY